MTATAQDKRLESRTHSVRVVAAHARISAAHELQYRANFWMQLLHTVLTLCLSLGSLWIVFSHVDQINGWSQPDLLVVLGCFFALGAFIFGTVHASATKLAADIKSGNFDYRLLKPVDAQLMGAFQQVNGWVVLELLMGIALVAIGLARGDADVTAAHVAAGIALFAVAVVIAASFWTGICTLCFWTIEGEGVLWSLDDIYDHVRWPVTILPLPLRAFLSTIFPIGLAVTVPAQAFTGRLGTFDLALALAVAVVCVVGSRLAWRAALRRYEGASA